MDVRNSDSCQFEEYWIWISRYFLSSFHVDYDNIILNGQRNRAEYTINYDQTVAGTDLPNILNSLREQSKDFGLDPDKATED